MKLIIAIIQPNRLEEVKAALAEVEPSAIREVFVGLRRLAKNLSNIRHG